jgi:hypothetical protein
MEQHAQNKVKRKDDLGKWFRGTRAREEDVERQ